MSTTKYAEKLSRMTPEQRERFYVQRRKEKRKWKQKPRIKKARKLYKRLKSIRDSLMRSTRHNDLIGCSPAFFKARIESLWLPGMSWENYGTVWEIDHIVPVASFDVLSEKGARDCFHYSNLRPLWCAQNRTMKVDKVALPLFENSGIYIAA